MFSEQKFNHGHATNEINYLEKIFNDLLPQNPHEAFTFAFNNELSSLMKIAQSKGAVPSRALMSNMRFNLSKISLLCDMGADLTMLDEYGRTILDEAFTENLAIAKMLIEKGAQFGTFDNEKRRRKLGQNIKSDLMRLFACSLSKRYPLFMTFIEENQLTDFLSIIKLSKNPINEIFSIRTPSGFIPHWYTVQLKIVQDNITLLVVDSEGFMNARWNNSYLFQLSDKILQEFPEKKLSIYVSKVKRQHDMHSCSTFSIYDVIDLHKMHHYLPKEFNNDIFAYAKNHTLGEGETISHYRQHKTDRFTLYFTRLPLRMMRAMQSTKLLNKIIPSYSLEEQTLPVNKNKETALISSSKKFIENKKDLIDALDELDDLPDNGKMQNERIKYKFDKMLKKAQDYLIETPLNEIIEAMEKFSLSELKKRILTTSPSITNRLPINLTSHVSSLSIFSDSSQSCPSPSNVHEIKKKEI